jgi:hypothetical protein
MAVRSVKNQYRGVNAHLHSFWQAAHKWNRFHNVHVGRLMTLLKAQLIPMGYTAEIEESLQIRRFGDAPRQPKADIYVSDLHPPRSATSFAIPDTPALELLELLEEEEDKEHPFSAIAVYGRAPGLQPGEPIAWIELLSPTNKGGTVDAESYRNKRRELLREGLVFVELDYLHETPPTFWRLPDYSRREPKSHAYRIVVLDPRPTIAEGRAYRYEFDVDSQIPAAAIPLNAGDVIRFDFDMAYQRTFEEALYGYDLVYSELPPNFERYSPADQQRIAARMLAVLEAARDGIDLETGPFPVKDIPLEQALEQISTLTSSP